MDSYVPEESPAAYAGMVPVSLTPLFLLSNHHGGIEDEDADLFATLPVNARNGDIAGRFLCTKSKQNILHNMATEEP